MDIILAARTLKKQLVAFEDSQSTISLIDVQLEKLGCQSLMSSIEENQTHHLHQLLRISVMEGVRDMYQHYSRHKWAQVQHTARTIKSSLEADGQQQKISVMTSYTETLSMDKAAAEWTSIMCELSRHD